MKKRANGVLTILLTLVFVNFVVANTVFTHTHSCFDGHVITHSHPYLPSAHHSHSQHALDSIASFNSAAASMDVVQPVFLAACSAAFAVIAEAPVRGAVDRAVFSHGLRGPPACV